MKYGNIDIKDLKYGSQQVDKVMYGTQLIWPDTGEVTDIIVRFSATGTEMNFTNDSWSYDDGVNSGSYVGHAKVPIQTETDVNITISKGAGDTFTFYQSGDLLPNNKILFIKVNDTGLISTLSYSFRDLRGLTDIIFNGDMYNFTNIFGALYNCSGLEYIGDLLFPNATDLRQIFVNCTALVCISSIDFSSGVNMAQTYANCPLLVEPAATGTPVRNGTSALAGVWSNSGACPPIELTGHLIARTLPGHAQMFFEASGEWTYNDGVNSGGGNNEGKVITVQPGADVTIRFEAGPSNDFTFFNNTTQSDIAHVELINIGQIISLQYVFRDQTNIKNISFNCNTVAVTMMELLFFNCSGLGCIDGNINSIAAANAGNTDNMFDGIAGTMTQPSVSDRVAIEAGTNWMGALPC